MIWNVEYTTEFGEWYRGLSEPQQDDITAGTLLLLMELGPQLPIPHPGTRTCASFACKAAAGRFGRFTPSIRGDRRSCLLAAIKPATITSRSGWCRSPTTYTTRTSK